MTPENVPTTEDPTPEMRSILAPPIFSATAEQRCTHETCDQATCPWDICASPYWEERRLHAILMHPGASRGEIHARM